MPFNRLTGKKIKFVIFLAIFLSYKSFAQLFPGHFQRYTMADGLSSENTRSLLHDSKGYIWVGTKNGLNRFNGSSFDNFMHDNDDPNSISGNFIKDIYEDSEANIWVLTGEGGLCILNRQKNGSEKFAKGDRWFLRLAWDIPLINIAKSKTR